MKKILFILLLFSTQLFSQVEIKTTVKGYYHGLIDSTSLQNRTRFDLAKDDVQNFLIANGGGTGFVQAPYWQIDVKITSTDTITNIKPFEPYYKDTIFYAKQINKIFDSISSARYFSIMYRPDSTKRHIKVISVLAKDSIPKPLNCTECGVKDIKLNFRTYYDTPESIRRVELGHQYIVKSNFAILETAIRYQDSTNTRTQTYANEDWVFSVQYSNDGITWGAWIDSPEATAGQSVEYTINGITYPLLYRHTHNSDKKYTRIRAISRRTGKIDIGSVIINQLM